MKEIILTNAKDFHQLEELKGKEYIIIILSKKLNLQKIEAINLKNFKGTIEIKLEDPKTKLQLNVITTNPKKTYLFFYATTKVTLLNHAGNKVSYNYIKEQEFDKESSIYNLIQHSDAIEMEQNLVLNTLLPNLSKLPINGNGYCIYATKHIINILKQNKNCQNVSFFQADVIIPIRKMQDFHQLENYSTETVVLNLENDLGWDTWKPLNLEHFYGTLIILGNNKKIEELKIEDSNSNSIGLISEISTQANLLIYDLTIQKVFFPQVKKQNVGCLLGARNPSKTPYYTFPGKTLFQNCNIKSVQMIKGVENTGLLAGVVDEFAECYNCNFKHIIFATTFHNPFGNQIYFTSENLITASHNSSEQKRICIDASSKRTKRK